MNVVHHELGTTSNSSSSHTSAALTWANRYIIDLGWRYEGKQLCPSDLPAWPSNTHLLRLCRSVKYIMNISKDYNDLL